MRKNYILDANILIHDPQSIFQFADNTVLIPVGVIGELDRFKKEQTARGFNARMVVRLLDSLRGEASLAAGVRLKEGGALRVYCESDRPFGGENGHVDFEILRIAKRVQETEPQTPVVIVTKDISLRIRADAAGLRAEDYETDRVELTELYPGHAELTISSEELALFRAGGAIVNRFADLSANEYVLLRSDGDERGSALARCTSDLGRLVELQQPDKSFWGVQPRNKEQYFAIDALLQDSIPLVTLMGKAGTGKTLLALGAALSLSLRRKRFRGVLICRPIVPVGRDLGFLPGDVEQKLDPWLKPITDTIDFLFEGAGQASGHADAASLIRAGVIEIQPLTYIRGRSIANRFVVIDEAQNLTPLEVKTLITRMGQGAKVALTGDVFQIDNPYVDATSNGFTYLVNRFRNQPIAAHVELRKGERSTLAELAANLL